MADGLLPDPRHHPLHDRARHGVDRRRASSIAAATSRTGCARAWSWLILKTTGVRVDVEGLERLDAGHDLHLRRRITRASTTSRCIFASLPYQLRIIAKESLGAVSGPRLAPAARRPPVRRSPPSRSRRHPARWRALVSEGLSLIIFAEGHAQPGRPRRAVQGRQLPAGDRGGPADRAARGDRHASGDAEGPAADRAGRRHADRPRSDSAAGDRGPTVRDARALADRVHAVVAASGRDICRIRSRRIIVHMFVTAIIAAGGRGLRFGGASPSSCWRSAAGRFSSGASRFLAHPAVDEVVVALPRASPRSAGVSATRRSRCASSPAERAGRIRWPTRFAAVSASGRRGRPRRRASLRQRRSRLAHDRRRRRELARPWPRWRRDTVSEVVRLKP